MRATIVDIAREAGVSTATVDRVLNQRNGVRGRTRDQVMAAARRLGYVDGGPATGAAAAVLDFILPGGSNTFMHRLAGHIESAGAERNDAVQVRIHRVEGFAAEVLAHKLESVGERSQGIGIVALDHPQVREAIRTIAARGIPVLTLVSDISNVPRCAYVGIDNRAAGRLAGQLLGRFMRAERGKVALLAGSLSYRGHEEREMGFRHMLAEASPGLTIIQTREVREDVELAYAVARALLRETPDLGGIYNIGSGNRGIAHALEETGRGENVVFLGHELTEHTRRYLLSGIMDGVIDQDPRTQARRAIDHLLRILRREPIEGAPSIGIQAIFRENLPAA
jgi:LacI family transcriptional regulator